MPRPKRWWFVAEGKSPNANLKVHVHNQQGRLVVKGDNKRSPYPAVTEVRLLTEEEKGKGQSARLQPVKVRLCKVYHSVPGVI